MSSIIGIICLVAAVLVSVYQSFVGRHSSMLCLLSGILALVAAVWLSQVFL